MAAMATLANGSEPLPDIGASATVYGSDLNDLMYLNNATASSSNITTNEGNLISELLTDEQLQMMEIANSNSNNNSFSHYYHYHHQYNSHRYQNCNVTEDRMDASSDSAVSSMSSDRVHSLSEAVSFVFRNLLHFY